MSNKSHYNKKLKPLAKNLRNDSTKGEIILWSEVLRAKQFHGYQFNRQFAMKNYIVDFICRKLKLIIEIDGQYHDLIYEKDKLRDETLKELGYHVIRFQETEIYTDLDNVI